jgi:hypothetical protein
MASSSTLNSGFQYTPVLSKTAWVQPSAINQSRQASRSGVSVLKVLIVVRALSPAAPIIKQTVMVFWCTSIPQQRSIMASITGSFRQKGGGSYVEI